jgi:hypothetical protein
MGVEVNLHIAPSKFSVPKNILEELHIKILKKQISFL